MRTPRIKSIMENHPHTLTDKLYEPLRQAISKGSLSSRKEYMRSESPLSREVKYSKLTRRMHEINPHEAHQMEKSIYMPAFRKLRETHKMEKNLENKKFTAIDVNIKEERPITQQQLRQRLCNVSLQTREIVYMQSQTPSSSQLIYDSSQNFLPIQRTISREFEDPSERKLLTAMTKAPQSQPPQNIQRMINLSQNSSSKILPTIQQMDKKKNRLPSPTYSSQIKKLLQQKKTVKNKSKNSKSNLYSCLDVSVNSHCNTCSTQNQIIASKPRRQRWVE